MKNMKILFILFLIFAFVAAQQQPSKLGKRNGTVVPKLPPPGGRLTAPTIIDLYNRVPNNG